MLTRTNSEKKIRSPPLRVAAVPFELFMVSTISTPLYQHLLQMITAPGGNQRRNGRIVPPGLTIVKSLI